MPDPIAAALLESAYAFQQEQGVFDPESEYNRRRFLEQYSGAERALAVLGQGMKRGLTLGFGDDVYDQSLDVAPGRLDWTDVLAAVGDLGSSLPAAAVTGGAATAGARVVAPRLAARAGAVGGLGRLLQATVGQAPEGVSLARQIVLREGMGAPAAATRLGRVAQGVGANVIEGLPLGGIEVGRSILQDEGVSGGRLGSIAALNVLLDALTGGVAGGLRTGGAAAGPRTHGDDTVTLPPDVAAQANALGFDGTPRALPPGRYEVPPAERTSYPRRFDDGSLGINPSAVDAPGPGVIEAEILGFEDALPALPARAGALTTPAPAGSVLNPNLVERIGPLGVTAVRRAPPARTLSPVPAPPDAVPVDPAMAAKAAAPPAAVLSPEELAAVAPVVEAQVQAAIAPAAPARAALGMEEPVAPAALGMEEAPPVAAPVIDAPPPLVDPGALRSQRGRQLADEVNAAAEDRPRLFGILANLALGAEAKVPAAEREALQAAITARLEELPDAAPSPRTEPPPRPTEPAPAPAEGGLQEKVRLAAIRHKGQIYEHGGHGAALGVMIDEGVIPQSWENILDRGLTEADLRARYDLDLGFTSTSGSWLSRAEAADLSGTGRGEAIAIREADPEYEARELHLVYERDLRTLGGREYPDAEAAADRIMAAPMGPKRQAVIDEEFARAREAGGLPPGEPNPFATQEPPRNLFGEPEEPVVEQGSLLSDRDFAAGEKARADAIAARKMTADEVAAATRAEGRGPAPAGEATLFEQPTAPAAPAARPRKGVTAADPAYVDREPPGRANNSIYAQARTAARSIPDAELRTRYERNLRVNIIHSAEAAANPSKARRVDRDDKDRPIYVPTSRGAEKSRWQETNSLARTVAYENELRARGLEVPDPDDAFRGIDASELPEPHRPTLERVRAAKSEDALRRILADAEKRAQNGTPQAAVERAIAAGELRHRGLRVYAGEALERGEYVEGLRMQAAGPGLDWKTREAMRTVLNLGEAADVADRELVEDFARAGFVDDSAIEAAKTLFDEWGAWRLGANVLLDPLVAGTIGGIAGGTAGAAADREDPGRGFVAGAIPGFLAGATGGAAGTRALRRAGERADVADAQAGRALQERIRQEGGPDRFVRVTSDEAAATPPREREERGALGFPLAPPPAGAAGFRRMGAWAPGGQASLDGLAEPRIVMQDRPRGLGFFETMLRSPTDLFRKYSPAAADVAKLGAEAVDRRNNFLDLRRAQVKSAFAGLDREQSRTLWNLLDTYPLLSDAPMQVPERLRDAFLEMRRVFRDDVVQLFEMKRGLLGRTDRELLDEALARGARESTLPDTFPEHLRPLVAMKTGEWGISSYWPHVFDGNWHVQAGEHSSWFATRNQAEAYAKKLHGDGRYAEDISVTHEISIGPEAAQLLPRDKYWKLVEELRASLGLDSGSVVRATGEVVRPGPKKRFLAHERKRGVNLQTFEQDPGAALDLYYHRWASKLAFDPFRVRSAELLQQVDPQVGGLRTEVEDYIHRVQGLPSETELSADRAIQRAVLWMTGGTVETKPFALRRATQLAREAIALSKLGFSPVSAVVNLTQTVVNTAPALGERWAVAGAREALEFHRARISGSGWDPQLEAMLRDTGALTIHPQHLVDSASVGIAPGLWDGLKHTAMWMFDKAESVNRTVAATAAFRKATAPTSAGGLGLGYGEAVDYAREYLRKTQFRYDNADLPKVAAGPVGKLVFQFQTYAIKQIEFMAKLAKEDPAAFARSIAYLGALTGVRGLLLGTPLWMLNTLAEKAGLLKDEEGVSRTPAEVATEHLPAPLVYGALGSLFQSDVSQRAGFGTAAEFRGGFGPTIATVRDLMAAREAYDGGNPDRAAYLLRRALPVFATRLYNAWQMHETGEVRDSWGRTVRPATGGDVVRASVGLRGFESARDWDRESIRRRFEGRMGRASTAIRNRLYKALDEEDWGAMDAAIEEAIEKGINLNPASVRRGYSERRIPELRSIRRTRAGSRERLFDSEILRYPE